MMYNNWGWPGMMGSIGFGLGGIFMIIVWVLIIWAIIALIRGGWGHGGCCGGHGHGEHGGHGSGESGKN